MTLSKSLANEIGFLALSRNNYLGYLKYERNLCILMLIQSVISRSRDGLVPLLYVKLLLNFSVLLSNILYGSVT